MNSVAAMRRGVAVLFALLAYCGFAQCEDAKVAIGKPNIIVILIDTLRADHLGCYGYDRNTSPAIDILASEGLVFESAYSGSSFTRESVSTLFTGLTPSLGGHAGWDAKPAEGHVLIAEYLAKLGYATGLFTNSVVINDRAFFQGVDTAECLSLDWAISGGGPRLSRRALRFLDKHNEGPFFMYLHYMDPHAPYKPPTAVEKRFTRRMSDAKLRIYPYVRARINELVASGFGPGDFRFDNLIDRYDAEIADTDSAVRILLDGLKARGLDKNTMVVVTADHGEEFLEHGYVEHAWTLYEESIRVPLILWAPGKILPGRVQHPVSLASFYATLVTFLGGSPSDWPSDAAPLLDWQDEHLVATRSDAPVVSELLLPHRNVVRMVRQGKWKFIQAQKWLTPEERREALTKQKKLIDAFRSGARKPPAPSDPPELEVLYDLRADPDESRDLLLSHRETADRLRESLEVYKSRFKFNGPKANPIPQAGDMGEDPELLRSLGYF